MWEMDDKDGPWVAKFFYEEMFKEDGDEEEETGGSFSRVMGQFRSHWDVAHFSTILAFLQLCKCK